MRSEVSQTRKNYQLPNVLSATEIHTFPDQPLLKYRRSEILATQASKDAGIFILNL